MAVRRRRRRASRDDVDLDEPPDDFDLLSEPVTEPALAAYDDLPEGSWAWRGSRRSPASPATPSARPAPAVPRTSTAPAGYPLILEAALQGVKPPVRRMLRVGSTLSFRGLHDVLQAALGWSCGEAFAFQVGGLRHAGRSWAQPLGEGVVQLAKDFRLDALFKAPGDEVTYLCGWGRAWPMTVRLLTLEARPRRGEDSAFLVGGAGTPPDEVTGGLGRSDHKGVELLHLLAEEPLAAAQNASEERARVPLPPDPLDGLWVTLDATSPPDELEDPEQGLGELERRLLRAAAVDGRPIRGYELARALGLAEGSSSSSSSSSSSPPPGAVLPALARLVAARLLTRMGSFWAIHPAARAPLLRRTVADGTFPALAAALEAEAPAARRLAGEPRDELDDDRRALLWAVASGDGARLLAVDASVRGRRGQRGGPEFLLEALAILVPGAVPPVPGIVPPVPGVPAVPAVPTVDPAGLGSLDAASLDLVLPGLLAHVHSAFAPAEPLVDLARRAHAVGGSSPRLRVALAAAELLRGRPGKARSALEGLVSPRCPAADLLRGLLALATIPGAEGAARARAAFRAARPPLDRAEEPGERTWFWSLPGPFALVPALVVGAPDDLAEAAALLHAQFPLDDQLESAAEALARALGQRRGDPAGPACPARGRAPSASHATRAQRAPAPFDEPPPSPLLRFLDLACLHWSGRPLAAAELADGRALLALAQAAGLDLLAAEAADLVGRHDPGAEAERALARDLRARHGLVPLLGAVPVVEPWETALKALARVADPEEAAGARERLLWQVTTVRGRLAVEALVQTRAKRGGWTRGRRLDPWQVASYKRGKLPAADRRVQAALEAASSISFHGEGDAGEVFEALVGHPNVVRAEDPEVRVEVVARPPALHVRREPDGLVVRLEPAAPAGGVAGALAREEGPSRVVVTSFRDEHVAVARALGPGLRLPERARPELERVLAALAPSVTVNWSAGEPLGPLQSVPPDLVPRVQLRPAGDGLRAELVLRPLGPKGPCWRPGEGGEVVAASVDGRSVQAKRDLSGEVRAAGDLLERCPTLAAARPEGDARVLDGPGDALAAVAELAALGPAVAVEWPAGQPIRVTRRLEWSDLHLSVAARDDWFDVGGELAVDEGLVVDFGRLLALARATRGTFLPLDGGRFLALSRELRSRLDAVLGLSEASPSGARVHAAAVPVLRGLLDETADLEADAAWRATLERLDRVAAAAPTVPAALQADLRPYQADGVRWLLRLAGWGVGACLADDMGVGKTVQVLAALVARASAGPALVVAPTSVVGGWLEQATRFAPTLRLLRFGPGDRAGAVRAAAPCDVLVASYALAQQEQELLATRLWHTVVLDEAQAIKNRETKRFKAAVALRADWRVAMTGTPVENHLGELWAIFRFLCPGLLGSAEAFATRFAEPIEARRDEAARGALRRILQPFVLRRTKGQVLEELPPKTEVVRTVERDPDEAAFYEALRRQSLARLEAPGADGDRRFAILAELTRLRRACCHPRLVSPEAPPGSAKLDAFEELVAELRGGGHRALVFSQFVDCLTLARERLDRAGVPYQYLDGSTPTAERERRVAAFQAGEGDLFLISLRAGGLGLNLTAADYVLLLDPWWNPAVEAQAADRVHRMGQTRPVTVYRLVVRDSVEEKIVDLHAHKRELAERLLEGADVSAALDPEALLELLRG